MGSERCCGPVPVTTLKQTVETSYCILILTDFRSDVLWCFTPFYLYTLTFVVLNYLSLYSVEFE